MIAFALHGGAGNGISRAFSPRELQSALDSIHYTVEATKAALLKGQTAVEAVVSAICILEDNPLFNAGKGSVLTGRGTVEMDAALMCGASHQAGSVSGVQTIRNPIQAAKAVLHHPVHCFLTGEGAEQWALSNGVESIDPRHLQTDTRKRQLARAIRNHETGLDHDLPPDKLGTVGAVVLDRHGNLAAGTSTGGMTNQRSGRVGDTPVIGAGTWASNETCAVSCTGQGEFFLRGAVARDIDCRRRYLNSPLLTCAEDSLRENVGVYGGQGGLIAVDQQGHLAMPFNTLGMFRGAFSQLSGDTFVGVDPA